MIADLQAQLEQLQGRSAEETFDPLLVEDPHPQINETQNSTSPPNYMRFPTLKKVDEFLEIDESCERASFPDQHNTCGNLTINLEHPCL